MWLLSGSQESPRDCCMVTGGAPRPTAQQVVQADCWLLRKRILQMKGIPDRNESAEGNGGEGEWPKNVLLPFGDAYPTG